MVKSAEECWQTSGRTKLGFNRAPTAARSNRPEQGEAVTLPTAHTNAGSRAAGSKILSRCPNLGT